MSHSSRLVSFGRRFFALLALWVGSGVVAHAALPETWSSADIGTVGVAGSSTFDAGTGTYTIKGSGAEVGGTADNFQFASKPVSGDVSIVARISSLTNTNTSAKGGVMIRETLAANARNVFLMVTPGAGAVFQSRATAGGSSTKVTVTGVTAPRWLKLERRGNVFSGYLSADGETWTLVNRAALTMGADVYLGLAACSRSATLLTTAVMDHVLIDDAGADTALPWPWTEHTVGAPTDAGVALFDGSYVLANLGADIASTADKFKFVSQTLTGDGTLTLKVASLTAGTSAPRFGLMMRSSLDANSVNVLVGLTIPSSLVFQSRQTPGGATAARATAVTVAYPTWLKLERAGNTFTASYSSDGATWTTQGMETLVLPSTIQVGAAYSNRSTTAWGLGVGDELRLATATDTDGNGMPDAWEIAHFGALGVNLHADPDSDGLSNYQEWELGNDPAVANASGQHPVLTQVSGNAQEGVTGAELAQPLVVRVTDSLSGNPVAGASVAFQVLDSESSIGSAGSWVSSLTATTDANGQASTRLKFPSRAGNHVVQATLGAGLESGRVLFTAKALAGEAPFLIESASLGAPLQSGSVDYADGAFTLRGTATAIVSTADTGHFAWQTLEGDGYIVAKVESFDAVDSWSRAGLMIRETLDANSPNAFVVVTPGMGVAFQGRDTAGVTTTNVRKSGVTAPMWLLLRRSGNTFSAFYSGDRQTWQSVGASRVITMGSTVNVGLALSTVDTVYRSAVFTAVRVSPLADAPWQVADVGLVNTAVIEDYSAGSILMRGGGGNISVNNDKFRYVYQTLPGDGRIIARVASQLATQATGRSGVMIRQSLDAGAPNIILTTAPSMGLVFQKRATTGAQSASIATQPSITAPVWLKLEKLGSQISAYTSVDGLEWNRTGTQTLDLGTTPLIGLAAYSNISSAHTETRFDHLSVDRFGGARGWNGSYYDGANFETLRTRRRDYAVDAVWAAGEVPAAGVSAAAYSVRWEADLVPEQTETYTFKTTSQGAVRVIVNGVTVIDHWVAHTLADATGTLALTAGVPVRIVVEYANATGAAARVQLRLSSVSQPEEVVSSDAIRPFDLDCDGLPDAWEAAQGLDPLNPSDAPLDPDGDGLSNLQEYLRGGRALVPDDHLVGGVMLETWMVVPGEAVSALTTSSRFFETPTSRQLLDKLDAPVNVAANYGRRIRGYIVPPVDGAYQFWLAADEWGEFWLSSDDNPFNRVRIAQVSTPVAYQTFDTNREQHSAPIQLQAGRHYYFEVLHKEQNGTDHVSMAWTRPDTNGREVIQGANLALFAPVSSADADGDGLPDAWSASHGLLSNSLSLPDRSAYGDADGDGLINLREYQQGSDPLLTDTDGDGYNDNLETLVSSDPTTASDLGLNPWVFGSVGEGNSSAALAHRVSVDSFRVAGMRMQLAQHRVDAFPLLYRAMSGDFEFTTRVVTPDAQSLGFAAVSVRADLSATARSLTLLQDTRGQTRTLVRMSPTSDVIEEINAAPVYPTPAIAATGYWFRIRREGDVLRVYYSMDGNYWVKSLTRVFGFGETCYLGLATCYTTNSGTTPVPVTVRDFQNVSVVTDLTPLASPEAVPPEATATVIVTMPGNTGVIAHGNWRQIGTDMLSQTITGKLDYVFTAPADGLYRVQLNASSTSNRGSNTLYPIEFSVDGHRVARLELQMAVGADGTAQIVIPWLKAGTHTIRLWYDNTVTNRLLLVRSLVVEALGGPDVDANGRADWIEARLSALNTLASAGSAYVSPASLTGRTHYRSLLALTAGTQAITVNPAPGYGWYADVPLSETAPVEVAARFENEGSVQGVLLTWAPLNLLAVSAEDFPQAHLQVRKGDRLRFTAYPADATGGSATVSIAKAGEATVVHTLADPINQPVVQTFTVPGVYTVTATYANESQSVATTEVFTIEVITVAFAGDPVVGLNNTAVRWDNPQVFDNVLLEVDQGLLLVKQSDLSDGGSRFALINSNASDSYIVARLGENGPILGHATVHSLSVATVSDNGLTQLAIYPDDSQLIGVNIVVKGLTDQTWVHVEIIVQGVTFEDGTTTLVLTKAHFNQYGAYQVKFIYPAGLATSFCHQIHVYEGAVDLGIF